MKMRDTPKNKESEKTTHTTFIAILVMLVCLVVVIATIELAKLSGFSFIADHRNVIVSVELTVFVMTLVEVIGRTIVASFRRRGIEPVGQNIRTIMRGVVYIILTVAIISTLLSNPAIADKSRYGNGRDYWFCDPEPDK